MVKSFWGSRIYTYKCDSRQSPPPLKSAFGLFASAHDTSKQSFSLEKCWAIVKMVRCQPTIRKVGSSCIDRLWIIFASTCLRCCDGAQSWTVFECRSMVIHCHRIVTFCFCCLKLTVVLMISLKSHKQSSHHTITQWFNDLSLETGCSSPNICKPRPFSYGSDLRWSSPASTTVWSQSSGGAQLRGGWSEETQKQVGLMENKHE